MAIHVLSAASIKSLPLTDAGKAKMHGDGAGLSVLVEPTKHGVARSYNFRFTSPVDASRQIMRLGTTDEISLSDARIKCRKYREMIREGKDPRHAIGLTAAGQMTFKEYADKYWTDLVAGNDETLWRQALDMVAKLHDKPIGAITLDQVFEVVKPFWAAAPVFASRRLRKVAKIFNHAHVRKLRSDNPALTADLKALGLEDARKLSPVVPHNALPYAELPAMMHKLSYQPEITARAVEFCVLTGTRSQETREARWSWLNDDMTTIEIPAEFMKGRKAHVIPLATQVTEMLKTLPRVGERIFPSAHTYDTDKALVPQSLLHMVNRVLLREGKKPEETIKMHGFRSTFRDYCADKTEFAREVIEFCLAHREGSASEKAYWRSDMIEKRRAVMQAYADYATGAAAPANVVPFKKEVA